MCLKCCMTCLFNRNRDIKKRSQSRNRPLPSPQSPGTKTASLQAWSMYENKIRKRSTTFGRSWRGETMLWEDMGQSSHITKTCLYNFDPLKPHFYTVNLGFTGVYINFPISAQNHGLWVLRTEAVPTSTHNLCFEQKFENYQNFSSESFHFLGW